MFHEEEGLPCRACRTVHEPYADEICAINAGTPQRHGYERHIFDGCTCPTCTTACHRIARR